ncbi:laminin subunit beta-1-like [Lineus longissimus]|uniref:laminin subunit beta-1-like n=1 Tax=Lineus longissimus TaxID=88925 RepID=UPI00315CFF1F
MLIDGLHQRVFTASAEKTAIECNCNDHADSCTYNATLGHGQCNDCYHNTRGLHCELCSHAFYPNETLALNNPNHCSDSTRSLSGWVEIQDQNPSALNHHARCGCDTDGTLNQTNVCDKTSGACQCKVTTTGRICGECKDAYYGFPKYTPDEECNTCDCDIGGSLSDVCDKVTGQCPCRPGVTGRRCNETTTNRFVQHFDAAAYQVNGGSCELIDELANSENPFTGSQFASCAPGQEVEFEQFEEFKLIGVTPTQWTNTVAIRYNLNGTTTWNGAKLNHLYVGDSSSGSCPKTGTTEISALSFPPGLGQSVSTQVNIDTRCRTKVTLSVGAGYSHATDIIVDSLLFIPGLYSFKVYDSASASKKKEYDACVTKISSLATRDEAINDPTCRALTFSYFTELYNGTMACACNSTGANTSRPCEPIGGQCSCKPGVFARTCDTCKPRYFNFTSSGCTACECSALGSHDFVCDYTTGQCDCKSNVAESTDPNNLGFSGGRQCKACKEHYYGFSGGEGCRECNCNINGSDIWQCNDQGECVCKPTITGEKCNQCQDGYYGFSKKGCMPCACTMSGSTSSVCDKITGQCPCRSNTEGRSCDACKDGTFNLMDANPDGCQPCFCYDHGSMCSSASGFVKDVIYTEGTNLNTASDADYFAVPSKFLGNQHRPYAQAFTVFMRGLTKHVAIVDQVFGKLEGNGGVIYYQVENITISTHLTKVEMYLHEKFWTFQDGSRPSAIQMQRILANLQGIDIRSVVGSSPLLIANVSLISAMEDDGMPADVVNFVENCTCSTGRYVEGLSCDVCKPGTHRNITNGDSYTPCKPCDCSGRTDTAVPECSAVTGECLNCRLGTVGFNCDSCASHVVGADCDACQDAFWNLQKDGCEACNCDSTGSVSPVCNKTSGLCGCHPHVVGDRCNICEENYFDLSSSGCSKCDICYDLIQDEVSLLRVLQGNLSNLVQELQSADENGRIGSFSDRLQQMMLLLEQLLGQLSQATNAESTVLSEVAHLAANLNRVDTMLQTVGAHALGITNSTLQAASDQQSQNDALLATVNSTVAWNYQLIQGALGDILTGIDKLVNSLDHVEKEIESVYQDAYHKSNNMTSLVTQMEDSIHVAEASAKQAKKLAENAVATQANTTAGITQLEQFLNMIHTDADSLLKRAETSQEAATSINGKANSILFTVNSLADLPAKTAEFNSRIGKQLSEAQSLTSEVNDATASNQSLVKAIKTAGDKTMALNMATENLHSESEKQLARAGVASQNASAAVSLEAQTLNDAQTMMNIVQNFYNKAQAVEKAANDSLLMVEALEHLSHKAIMGAQTLRSSLNESQINAQGARDNSSQAKMQADANNKELSPVASSAQQLQQISDTTLNNLDGKLLNVTNTNNTMVQPAKKRCSDLQPLTNDLEIGYSNASNQLQTKIIHIIASASKLNKIKTDIQNINKLNTWEIDDLKLAINGAKSDFENRDLSTMINDLITAKKVQQDLIDSYQVRKITLQAKLDKLRLLRNQLQG